MTLEELQVRYALFECIRELDCVQCVEIAGDHSQCATACGRELIKRGMELLGLKDLSAETLGDFIKQTGARND